MFALPLGMSAGRRMRKLPKPFVFVAITGLFMALAVCSILPMWVN